MARRLTPGQQAPLFTLPDAQGSPVSLQDLRGTRVILYFYPRAATPGCTTQACDFRDSLSSLAAAGYRVLGVSPDAPHALERFAAAQRLGFPLLSDEDHRVAESYGAWGEKKNYGKVYEGLIRSTVVLDRDGVVELAQYNVRAKGHVAKLRRDLGLGA
ncbi:thioredoxin-dependent thiol peroxidase [Kocuria tytonis]|uniref:thioredoxin-dependent peroxiredoxin n=1 Tax=Kocuria tytonis TaxID=2054280 RepID=A0A495A9A5_9MICC|nr:thioredoxin-dependent thiol peroxidase [Kocuria tytonis]RKQ36626.1 thioredoxin-dependent thiol peroxidase [Kocuria tytonis]